jgi:hypothetical protein
MKSAAPPPIGPRTAATWAAFCLLMLLVGLQERWYAGQALWPWPLFYELSSLLVATGVAAWRWHRMARDDPWLARPAMWFWRVLRWTPLVALAFVGALYGLRHAVRAAFGLPYEHQPWPEVLAYESLKFSVFYVLFAGVSFALRSFQALAAERLRTETLERLSTEARLAQLTQQMQPHLLHNALNTIAALVHDDPDAADAALLHLSQLLRAATGAPPPAAAPAGRRTGAGAQLCRADAAALRGAAGAGGMGHRHRARARRARAVAAAAAGKRLRACGGAARGADHAAHQRPPPGRQAAAAGGRRWPRPAGRSGPPGRRRGPGQPARAAAGAVWPGRHSDQVSAVSYLLAVVVCPIPHDGKNARTSSKNGISPKILYHRNFWKSMSLI